jgi:Ran GTPase-activating protein (RanGAP) involved in mRNA processing and transport
MSLIQSLLNPQPTVKPGEEKTLGLKIDTANPKLHHALLKQYAAELKEKPLAERTACLKAFAEVTTSALKEALSRALDMEFRLIQREDTVLDIFTEMRALCSADNTVAIEIFKDVFKPIIQSAAALNRTTIFFQAFQQIINLCAGDPVLCEMIGLWYECKIQNPEELKNALQESSYIRNIEIIYTLNDDEFIALTEDLKKNTTLLSLNLMGENIDDHKAIALAETLKENRTLTSLNLFCNHISDFGLESLAESLETNNTLTSLNLGSNPIVHGLRWIAKALTVNKSLSDLSLRSCRLNTEGIKLIATALSKNSTLKRLNLSTTQIDNEGLEALSRAVQENESLVSLDLSWNKIESPNLSPLSEALKVNKTLESLDLTQNNIDSANATLIAEALQVNKSLRTLNLSGNHIRDAGAFSIAEAITLNPSLTHLSLRSNPDMSDISKRALQAAFSQNPQVTSLDT